MIKNQASQIAVFFAFDTTTGAPKTGDAANITPYIIKDDGTSAALATATVAEIDATHLKGYYRCSPSQAETNFNDPIYGGVSATANIAVVATHYSTTPVNFHKTAIDSSGNVAANVMAEAGIPYVSGTATAGGASTITAQAGTTATQAQPGFLIYTVGGTGAGQLEIIDSFDAGTLIITIGPTTGPTPRTWQIANPAAGTTYVIIPRPGGAPASLADIFSDTENPNRTLSSAANITSTGGLIPMSAAGHPQVDVEEVKQISLQTSGSGTQNIGGP